MTKNGCWGVTDPNAGEAHPGGWDNGDIVAHMLRGRSRKALLELAKSYTGKDYTERYAHLNNGMLRANCGNLIRGALRRMELLSCKTGTR